jgi:hypothetical protein
LHSRNTTTASSSAADKVTVNQSPPSHPGSRDNCGRAHMRLSRKARKARRALRRDHRPRAAHFMQASEPSLASAPHAHARP